MASLDSQPGSESCPVCFGERNMRFTPFGDRILVHKKDADERTSGGLFIPDQAKDKPQEGTVVAIGEGIDGKGSKLNIGDRVLFGKYAGTEISLDDEPLFIMREEEVFGVLEAEEGDNVLHVSETIGEKAEIMQDIEQGTDSVLSAAHF